MFSTATIANDDVFHAQRGSRVRPPSEPGDVFKITFPITFRRPTPYEEQIAPSFSRQRRRARVDEGVLRSPAPPPIAVIGVPDNVNPAGIGARVFP